MAPDPYDDDEHHPDDWDDDPLVDSNGRDYNPYQGSITKTDGRCNAHLNNWSERYGEIRYCMGMPESTFVDGGSDFCRMHKSRDALMKQAERLFKHGVFARKYSNVFEKLDIWEQIECVQTFKDFLEESNYTFDYETVEWEFDVSDSQAPVDTHTEELAVPTQNTHAAKFLWMAALDLAKMERINIIQFDTGMDREVTVSVAENGDEITDLDEHHLHIAYSRLTKDIENHMENGGIGDDDGDELNVNVNNNENAHYISTVRDLETEDESDDVNVDVSEEDDMPLNHLTEDDE